VGARRTSDDLKEVIRDFRRDQVIDVARRLFGERGTTDVSMDEIASEAGVARSTVYVYFANRDELLRACLQRMHNQLVEAVATTWREDSDPARRLTALIEEMLARVDDNPAFFRLALITQGAPTDGAEAVGSELALIGLAIAGLIRDLVVDGIERGDLRRVDPDLATTLIGQQVYGAMAVRAEDPAPQGRSQAAADTVDFILHGLAA
jgi:TetR/AcrR family fatty acid metabolism transcriptional regulator